MAILGPLVYTYSASGVLTGSQRAMQSPKDRIGTWIIPAQATLVAPPSMVPAGQRAVFSPGSQTWALQAVSQ